MRESGKFTQFGRRASDRPSPKGMGWWPLAVLVVLSAIAATTALVSQQLILSRVTNAIPNEGFYWSVAQYQLAHQRLKQELRAIAAGEAVNAHDLSRRAAVLASRASILTEPSEVKGLLNGVPGFTAATHRIAEIQGKVGPILEKRDFGQADAVKVLALLQAAGDDDLVSQLANDVRSAEIAAKEDMARTLSRRIWWAWGGFALCWSALALWLFYAVRSRRRYRVAAHDRQRAVESMEQAIASKRKFLSMVNHEVRSPLQNIVASAELLAMKDQRPESVAAIRRIRHAVAALQGQLRDLLTIARSDSTQLPIQVETFELGELVQDVCAGLAETATAKGLDFKLELLPAPLTISADPIRIAQVLRNLVENAVRYTSHGRILVRVEPFTGEPHEGEAQRRRPSGGEFRLVVQDTGPGLQVSTLERLQAPVVPFAAATDGTGIGLFVVRDVLQQLGGRLDVQTKASSDPEGQGTIFTLSIPAVQVKNPVARGGRETSTGPLDVLVVDDLADVRDSISEMTRRLGHVCMAVGSAEEAWLALKTQSFDVVLIDLQMPGTDGLALATSIRERPGPNSASMLILISAAENQVIGQAWPFDGFLHKPISGQALAKCVGIS